DMVKEPAQRALYLQTLKEESTRLSTLVENVLAYARLEEGRGGARRERIALADLIARHRPVLERRARDGGLALEVIGGNRGEAGGEVGAAELETDVDAVGQVLFNLVDNACKYAKGSTPAALELSVRVEPARARPRAGRRSRDGAADFRALRPRRAQRRPGARRRARARARARDRGRPARRAHARDGRRTGRLLRARAAARTLTDG